MSEEEKIPPMTYLEQRRAFIEAGRPLPDKKVYRLKPVSDKRKAKIAAQNASGDSLLDAWFEDRRKEMIGRCLFCSGKTEKDNDQTYRHSIAHLLPKKDGIGGFPSVATHPDNWIELCFYGNSCHTNFDNHMISWEMLKDSAEWALLLEKFLKVYPSIRQEERSSVPEIFLPYIK